MSLSSVSRSMRSERRGRKRLIQELEFPEKQEKESEEKQVKECEEEDPTGPAHLQENLQNKLDSVIKERDSLLMEKREWIKERTALRLQLESASEKATTVARKVLSRHFSSSQIDYILSGIPVTKWSDEDISRALTLHNLSPKAYRYLRDVCKFPFPCRSTLSRWVSKINVEPGVLQSVLTLLQQKATTMPEFERLCAISFDECSVSQEWSYDKKADVFHEAKSKVQCVMLRGLTNSWKQLVYYDFDKDMTKQILFDLIMRIEATGFQVVAMVNDLGPTNIKLWNSLGIDYERTSFTNPADAQREVHVFADAPHLIKLIRNNFLDHGFELSGGKFVSGGCVREIVCRSVSDLKPTHRLSEKHIAVTGHKRMNVRLAAQLLSETTAKALKFYGEKSHLKCKNWEATSNFILLADSWFDFFNSKLPVDLKCSRNGYSISLEKQNQVLHEMIETATTMKVCGSNKRYQFQKGLVISSQSLMKLYDMVKKIMAWHTS